MLVCNEIVSQLISLKMNYKGIKVKFAPRTGHEGLEVEQMYSSTISLTSALDSGGWLLPRSGRFTHGERDPVHIV